MNARRSLGACAVLIVAVSCGGSTLPVPGQLTLSANQAATLMSRIRQISVAAPELSWLADSANVVLAAGAEADSVPIVTTRTTSQFYAVGLQRRFPSASSAFSTFTFIAFDSPDSPTNFIVIDGYAASGAAAAPQSISGSFGSSNSRSLFGFVFHIGGTVTTWQASANGSASMAAGSGTVMSGCSQAPSGPTCTPEALLASFSINAGADTVGSTITPRTASMAASTVAGIALTFPVH